MSKSKKMRNDEFFMRNKYKCVGKFNIPLVKKQTINLENIILRAYSDINKEMPLIDKLYGVHFFVDDYRFENVYAKPTYYLSTLSRYGFVLTPDYSLYADMPQAIQLFNLFKNRWCGAYWQAHGLKVIPTISWGLAQSYDFCFDGVEQDSIVAISTVGCRRAKLNFLRGYDKMLEKIKPETIICYGKTFPEMRGNIIEVPYFRNVKEVA
ncbi:DUF4417 domain-containing protein [bacterium]|nr:DUF4417 domain-containing protein [bacterium]